MSPKMLNILLVEDDELDVTNMKLASNKNNIADPLLVARNGLEALAMLRSEGDMQPQVPKDRRCPDHT